MSVADLKASYYLFRLGSKSIKTQRLQSFLVSEKVQFKQMIQLSNKYLPLDSLPLFPFSQLLERNCLVCAFV